MKRPLRRVHNAAIKGWKKLRYVSGHNFAAWNGSYVGDDQAAEYAKCGCYRGAAGFGLNPKDPDAGINLVDDLLEKGGIDFSVVIIASDKAGSRPKALRAVAKILEAA
jgi:hypothetical protein